MPLSDTGFPGPSALICRMILSAFGFERCPCSHRLLASFEDDLGLR
jgi:hypothetical protein